MTKRAEVIYQSRGAEERAFARIKKMLANAEISIGIKLVKVAFRLNQKFEEYHTLDIITASKPLV